MIVRRVMRFFLRHLFTRPERIDYITIKIDPLTVRVNPRSGLPIVVPIPGITTYHASFVDMDSRKYREFILRDAERVELFKSIIGTGMEFNTLLLESMYIYEVERRDATTTELDYAEKNGPVVTWKTTPSENITIGTEPKHVYKYSPFEMNCKNCGESFHVYGELVDIDPDHGTRCTACGNPTHTRFQTQRVEELTRCDSVA